MGRALTTAGRRSAVALLAVALAGAAPAPPPIRFEEIGEAAGARLPHHLRQFDGPHADVLETFTAGGSAVAVADYDGDGDEDLFVTDSDAGRPNRLLRNERVPSGALRFTEVAAAAGVAGGNDRLSIVADALWFEADGDGRPDLLVARFGTPLLYRNLGGGRFADVTAGSGLETEFGNTIAAIAFDADGDGRLDLLFGHYFKPVNLIELPTPHVLPNNLDEAVNGGGVSLWRNSTEPGTGRPRFAEVSEKAGLAAHTGWTLDIGHADLDDDGDQDLYLAGDYGTDRLYWNRGDGTFEDATKEAIGFDTKKGMNVDVGDYDRDGRLDVYVTNITDDYMRECNMLWHNEGRGSDGRVRFTDVAKETGTCNSLWGWAAKFADFDNDGWEDIFAADGLRSAGPEEYIPLVLGADPAAERGLHRRAPLAGNRQPELERLPEEEALPQPGRRHVQGGGGGGRRGQRPRRPRPRRRRLRRRRPPRLLPDERRPAVAALPQHLAERRAVAGAEARRRRRQPRRDRRPGDGARGERDLDARGQRRQRLRRPEHDAGARRARRGGEGGLGRGALAGRARRAVRRAARALHDGAEGEGSAPR